MSASENYTNNIPVITSGQTDPVSFSLIEDFLNDEFSPLGVNEEFIRQMKLFCDTNPYDGTDVDEFGKDRIPDLSQNIYAVTYIKKGDDVVALRRAPDCPPDEERFDETFVKKYATSDFVYYGKYIASGTRANAIYSFGDQNFNTINPDIEFRPVPNPDGDGYGHDGDGDTGDTSGKVC